MSRPPAPVVTVGPPEPWVPGPGLPAWLVPDRANNNLDLCRHDGELVLAWRTAPTHFASDRARLHVVRGGPGAWRHELTVAVGRDVREPRLVEWRGRLLMYWFTAGTAALRFEPHRIWVSERRTEGDWSEPEAISGEDHVVWRVRPVGGRLLMTVYRHAGRLFTAHPVPLSVEMWASRDGLRWEPADPASPEVHHGGSESDFVERPDGSLAVVVRKEGPSGGWGSDIGGAPAGRPTEWELRPDPRKLDSPFLFCDGDRTFLVTRRQRAMGGRFDLGLRRGSEAVRTKLYQAVYSATPKCTALYEVHPEEGRLTWLADLPSAGDTAFAGAVPLGGHRWLVANYTSPPARPWLPWAVAQTRPTAVTAVEVDLSVLFV
ncbi:MAG: sialidase family protein [Microthrixaceae bacterium]